MSSASSDGFEAWALRDGLLLDTGQATLSGAVCGVRSLEAGATHFGVVVSGTFELQDEYGPACLRAPTHFVCAASARLRATLGSSACAIITVKAYRGLSQLGRRLEDTGRLRYIDGCSDTLLVCPPRLGEPCLNHLHIPANTRQSSHTHPSVRLGAIARGRGWCVTPTGRHRLEPGMAWHIRAGTEHAFHTEDAALDVVAWHPDSDFGPQDDDHPMINRTIL